MNARAKASLSLLLPLGVLALIGLVEWGEKPPEKPSEAAPKAPAPVWEIQDFSSVKDGEMPQGWQAPVGTFGVATVDGKKALEFQHEPMVEGRVLLPGVMPGGGIIRARMRGDKARRAFPRFAIALTHDNMNFQLRALPGDEKIELVSNETSLASAAWDSPAAGWIWLELTAKPTADGTSTSWEGRCWLEGAARPESAMLTHQSTPPPKLLRASLHLAPYALKSIFVDRVETTSLPAR